MKRIFLLIVSLCMFSSVCMASPVYYYNYSNTSNYVYEHNTDKTYAQSVVDLVNRERLKAGVRPLILNLSLYTSPSPRDGLLSRMPSSA